MQVGRLPVRTGYRSDGPIGNCPLCMKGACRTVGEIDLRDVVSALEAKFAATASEGVSRYSQLGPVSLCVCRQCGLHFFTPQIVGDVEFYRFLVDCDAFNDLTWDHMFALRLVDSSCRLLDIGSGRGAFATAARGIGAEVYSLEYGDGNSRVHIPVDERQLVADVSHSGWSQPVQVSVGGDLDMVTAFQVLEPLPHPVEFLDELAGLVGPGGRIVVSVPNRKRLSYDRVEPLDCPPHHQTRWGARQLRYLGSQVGLDVELIRTQKMKVLREPNLVQSKPSNRVRVPSRRQLYMLARRLFGTDESWPLPWPATFMPWHIFLGHSIVVVYRK